MIKQVKKLISQEHGASPWIAIFAMTVLLAFVAMAVDMGIAYMQASKLQAALDAGALAGAEYLPDTAGATAAAIDCVKLNGYTASDVTVSFSDSNSKISLSSVKTVDTMFLKVIGISKWNVNRKAAAAKTGSGGNGIFDYRLFYGDPDSTFSMGGSFNINGSVHSNGGYSASPASSKITGSLEVVKKLKYSNITVGKVVNPAQSIDMPDFTEVVDNIMPDHYDEYANASTYNSPWWRQTWNGSKYITGNVSVSNGVDIYGDVYIKGNLSISGNGPFLIYGNLYVTGTISFGNTVNIYGSVMSDNTITFSGGQNFVNTDKAVCIYSKNGDINMDMQTVTTTGIVYAPNGTVKITGGNDTFNGSIVAKKINVSISGLKVGDPSVPYDFLPPGDTTVKLVG